MKDVAKKQIPQICGMYFFRDKHGQILYIGKAANLKVRISSYFNKQPKDSRISKMLDLAAEVTWQKIGSEIEALILESQLIKKYKPPFNVMLRDDKQYFYVGIIPSTGSTPSIDSGQVKKQFPRIFLTHQPTSKRLAKIESGVYTFHPKRYMLNAKFIGPFTDGMALKTTLKLLRRVFPYCTCKQQHNNYCLNYHIGKCPGFCCLKKSGSNFQRQEYLKNIKAIKGILESKRSSLIKQLKKEMLKLGKKNEFEKAIELRYKIEKLEKVFKNAQIIQNTKYKILNTKTDQKQTELLAALRSVLKLSHLPHRIEGYDISNIQGRFATGSMVVFTDGQPDKSQYRKFKIRLNNQPDDIAMLREVLTRRFNHPEWPYPDLMIIDGGKAQLNVTVKTIFGQVYGYRKTSGFAISVIALTKNEKHRGNYILLYNKKTPVLLKNLPLIVRNLILQIDAEAHRFAINYYRKLHKKTIIR